MYKRYALEYLHKNDTHFNTQDMAVHIILNGTGIHVHLHVHKCACTLHVHVIRQGCIYLALVELPQPMGGSLARLEFTHFLLPPPLSSFLLQLALQLLNLIVLYLRFDVARPLACLESSTRNQAGAFIKVYFVSPTCICKMPYC